MASTARQDTRILTGSDRRQQIITEAARLFARKEFDGTSMRDISHATGILPGSLYHHFASKENLFLAVHEAGMTVLTETVTTALTGIVDPWDRLSAAAEAHCSALLGASDLMILVVPKLPAAIETYRPKLLAQRDAYERIVGALVAALPLPADIDPKLFRLQLLGALNWTQAWYRPGCGSTPEEIGRQVVRVLRLGCGAAKRPRLKAARATRE